MAGTNLRPLFTGGTLPEMLADAKKAGISAILLTDHFRPPRDFIEGRSLASEQDFVHKVCEFATDLLIHL